MGAVISIILWITRIAGVLTAIGAVVNGQTAVVNAQAVGSASVPDIISTGLWIASAIGLNSTWLTSAKTILEKLGGLGQTVAPAPTPSGGVSAILSSLSLPSVLSLIDAATTWFSAQIKDKPIELKGTVCGFLVDLKIIPDSVANPLPQVETSAELLQKALDALEKRLASQSAARAAPAPEPITPSP